MAELNVESLRKHFPALVNDHGYIYGDNAGGSQCLKGVLDNIIDYLTNTNVQLGDVHYTPVNAVFPTDKVVLLTRLLALSCRR